MRSLVNSEYLDEYTLFTKIKMTFEVINTIFFPQNFNLCPLIIYNGPSQVYCIKPEGKPIRA